MLDSFLVPAAERIGRPRRRMATAGRRLARRPGPVARIGIGKHNESGRRPHSKTTTSRSPHVTLDHRAVLTSPTTVSWTGRSGAWSWSARCGRCRLSCWMEIPRTCSRWPRPTSSQSRHSTPTGSHVSLASRRVSAGTGDPSSDRAAHGEAAAAVLRQRLPDSASVACGSSRRARPRGRRPRGASHWQPPC